MEQPLLRGNAQGSAIPSSTPAPTPLPSDSATPLGVVSLGCISLPIFLAPSGVPVVGAPNTSLSSGSAPDGLSANTQASGVDVGGALAAAIEEILSKQQQNQPSQKKREGPTSTVKDSQLQACEVTPCTSSQAPSQDLNNALASALVGLLAKQQVDQSQKQHSKPTTAQGTQLHQLQTQLQVLASLPQQQPANHQQQQQQRQQQEFHILQTLLSSLAQRSPLVSQHQQHQQQQEQTQPRQQDKAESSGAGPCPPILETKEEERINKKIPRTSSDMDELSLKLKCFPPPEPSGQADTPCAGLTPKSGIEKSGRGGRWTSKSLDTSLGLSKVPFAREAPGPVAAMDPVLGKRQRENEAARNALKDPRQQHNFKFQKRVERSVSAPGGDGGRVIEVDGVMCKVRAKRGCATHPRSIAERSRRLKISENMRKLADLVPGMDRQANTSDMLEDTIDYMKYLQRQIRRTKVEHPEVEIEPYVHRMERGSDEGEGNCEIQKWERRSWKKEEESEQSEEREAPQFEMMKQRQGNSMVKSDQTTFLTFLPIPTSDSSQLEGTSEKATLHS